MATPANRRPPSKRATAPLSRGRRAWSSRASAPRSKRRAGRSPKPRSPPSTKSVWMASTWWTTSHSNATSPNWAAMNPVGVAAGRRTRSAIWIPTKAAKTKYEDCAAMTHRSVRFCLPLLLLAVPALAADQVVLTNGDIITGAIVKKDGGKLTIKSEFLGEVTMPWSAVKSIRSDADLSVVLPSGETVKGKISSSGDQLQVVAGAQTNAAPLTGVAAVRNDAEQHNFERMQLFIPRAGRAAGPGHGRRPIPGGARVLERNVGRFSD